MAVVFVLQEDRRPGKHWGHTWKRGNIYMHGQMFKVKYIPTLHKTYWGLVTKCACWERESRDRNMLSLKLVQSQIPMFLDCKSSTEQSQAELTVSMPRVHGEPRQVHWQPAGRPIQTAWVTAQNGRSQLLRHRAAQDKLSSSWEEKHPPNGGRRMVAREFLSTRVIWTIWEIHSHSGHSR